MNRRYAQLETWFKNCKPREQAAVFFLGLVLIHFLWAVLLTRPLSNETTQLDSQTTANQAKLNEVQQQINMIEAAVSQNSFKQGLLDEENLSGKSQLLQQKLSTIHSTVISIDDLPKVIKDILSIQGFVTLHSLKKLPQQPLIPADLMSADLPGDLKEISRYLIEIDFHSNYFNTIAYLKRLESLPWQFYWDSMLYNVVQYPDAEVVLKLYVLVNQKSGA